MKGDRMTQLESKISHEIVSGLNARGHVVWKNHGSIYSRKGLPDIPGFRKEDARGILLEVKRDMKGRYGLSRLQFEFLVKARERTNGEILCGVVSSLREAIEIVENGVYQGIDIWKEMID
jgi:Holliday junction resolvase